MNARRMAWIVLGLAACAAGPRALVLGEDQCDHCHMTLADARFGGEIVTATGRVLVYDAIECLRDGLTAVDAEVAGIWVVDFDRPGVLVPADSAFFLHAGGLRTPMGGGFAAFSSAAGRDQAVTRFGGEALTWAEVRAGD